jgi:tetratricopeptide (TPR) repeat protein
MWYLDPVPLTTISTDLHSHYRRSRCQKLIVLSISIISSGAMFRKKESRDDNVKARVVQANSYFRMLETHDDDRNDESPLSSDVDVDSSEDDDDDSTGDDIEEGYFEDDSYDEEYGDDAYSDPEVKIKAQDELLTAASKPSRECGNAVLRKGLWGKEPDYTSWDDTIGFLSRLARICVEAKIEKCYRPECWAHAEKMDEIAPECNWKAFRDWAITAMSCQAAMGADKCVSRVYTHIASVVSGCCLMLKNCNRHKNTKFLRKYLDVDRQDRQFPINLDEVTNIIFWMAKIQATKGIGPRKFGRWTHGLLSTKITLEPVERAANSIEELKICKHRLWKLVDASDRKQSDLLDIVDALVLREDLQQPEHGSCAPSKCQISQMDTTSVVQLHKCPKENEEKCPRWKFPGEHLLTALEQGRGTAWQCAAIPSSDPKELSIAQLSGPKDAYIAISHVWGDGTGKGGGEPGSVNSCLFECFRSIAQRLNCHAIWWDVISVPMQPKARSKALRMMHHNYHDAAYTVVHDSYLLGVPWKDDGSPCLALVLSSWFTRGWTALELHMSKKVKVLFKGLVLKDLDDEILAKSPDGVSRAYWLATTLIKKLRKKPSNIGDLLAILSPRTTSVARDRTNIAALLAGLPNFDYRKSESDITKEIITYLGKINYTSFMHGKSTMCNLGGFSWCASTLDDMPVDISEDMADGSETKYLNVDEKGAVEGEWFCRALQKKDPKHIHPYGDDLSSIVKVDVALKNWENCVLLRQEVSDPIALLAIVICVAKLERGPVLKCRYIGAVKKRRQAINEEKQQQQKPTTGHRNEIYHRITIRIGGTDRGGLNIKASDALIQMVQASEEFENDLKESKLHEDTDTDSEKESEQKNTKKLLSSSRRTRKSWAQSLGTPSWIPKSREKFTEETPTDEDLWKAMQQKDRNAIRYILDKLSGRVDETRLFQRIRGHAEKDKPTLAGITMVARVLNETGRYEKALKLYTLVDKEHGKRGPGQTGKSANLDAYQVKYEFGMVSLRINPKSNDDRCAEGLFVAVLKEYEKSAKYRKAEKARNWKVETATHDPNAGKKSQMHDGKWYRLELNAIAQLVLLYVRRLNFQKAYEMYCLALKEWAIDHKICGNEVFRIDWAGRATEMFNKTKARDLEMGKLYEKASKRFDTIFHKKHLLSALTTLHLGANYVLQNNHLEAVKLLASAEKKLKKHLAISDNNEHIANPMIGLAQYHLGVVYTNMGNHTDARIKLEEALSNVPPNNTNWLYAATICARAQNYLSLRPPNYLDAGNEFRKIFTMKLPWTDREFAAVGIEAYLGYARTVYRRPQRDIQGAKKLCEKVLEILESFKGSKKSGKYYVQECEAGYILADIYEQMDDLVEAEKRITKAMAGFQALHGENSIGFIHAAKRLSVICEKMGNKNMAEEMLVIAVGKCAESLGEYHGKTLKTKWQLGYLYLAHRKLLPAERYCQQAYQGFDETLGPNELPTIDAARTLGQIFMENGKFDEARRMFSVVRHYFCHLHDKNPKEYHLLDKVQSGIDLSEANMLLEEYGYADRLANAALKELELAEKGKHVHFDARLKLGNIYRQQGRYPDAWLHIVESFHGFQQLSHASPADKALEIKVLEAKLAFAQLKLNTQKRSISLKQAVPRELAADAVQMVAEVYEGLAASLGTDAISTMEAAITLGELHLIGRTAKGREHGAQELHRTLHDYPTTGHPQTIRIMNLLIEYYKGSQNQHSADEMRPLKFKALDKWYGRKEATMIMHMSDPERLPRKIEENGHRRGWNKHEGEDY